MKLDLDAIESGYEGWTEIPYHVQDDISSLVQYARDLEARLADCLSQLETARTALNESAWERLERGEVGAE